MLALRDSTAQVSNNSAVPFKMALIMVGIYIWEFVSSLGYEWDVIRGHQPYRWTIWIYLITRWAALGNAIVALITANVTSPIGCQAMTWTAWGLNFLAQGSASLLIVLRIFAIWSGNKVIVAIAATVWVTNLSFLLQGAIRIRAVWVPVAMSCVVTNIEASGKPTAISLLVTNVVLLLIMLAGLLRLCHRGSSSYELWQFLWKQGVIWLAIVIVAELPQAVLLILNKNESLDTLFLYPSIVTMVIAATRIHRSLQHFASLPTASNSAPDTSGLQNTQSSRLVWRNKDTSVPHKLEVTVHTDTACGEYPISQMNHCGSYSASDKSHKISADDNV